MRTTLGKPYYPYRATSSIDVLAKTLGVHPKLLQDISQRVDNSYTHFDISKKGKKTRTVAEPKFYLKKIQKRINSRILEHVQYPLYLKGGIRSADYPRDYVSNAEEHLGSRTLLNLDIKNFYPNIRGRSVFRVFKYLFRFPDDVSELLVRLVTLHGRVPQGACTSSYIANLIFFDTEYSIVSYFDKRGVVYTRLLDDITLSSKRVLGKEDVSNYISRVAAMCRKYDLRLNGGKTRVSYLHGYSSEFTVTSLWVGHGVPKLPRADRNNIRHLVYICEQEHKKDRTSDEYHKRWHAVSGKVAQLTRLGHAQAKSLRERLSAILPELDANAEGSLRRHVEELIKKCKDYSMHREGNLKIVNRAFYNLGILSRTNKPLARVLRKRLRAAYPARPSIREFWVE